MKQASEIGLQTQLEYALVCLSDAPEKQLVTQPPRATTPLDHLLCFLIDTREHKSSLRMEYS